VTTTSKSSVAYGNPDIPEARPHLCIKGKIICRKFLPALRQTLTMPAYHKLLKTKLNWTQQDINQVNWPVLHLALESFPPGDQRRILLFINDKLPLQTSKAHPHHGSTLCPSCQRDNEDREHFLTCLHPTRKTLFNDLKRQLTSLTQNFRLHPCLHTAIWLGLVSTRHGTPYPDVNEDVLEPLQPPIKWQSRLGWEQVYQGRMTTHWAQAVDIMHPELPMNGMQVMTKIQIILWNYILAIWKQRNDHLHHNVDQLDRPNYQQAVTTLYEQRHLLPPTAQQALYRQPLETMLELPTIRLQTWTTRGYDYFQQQLKAAKKQATLNTQDIRQYFTPKTQQDNDLQPP